MTSPIMLLLDCVHKLLFLFYIYLYTNYWSILHLFIGFVMCGVEERLVGLGKIRVLL